MREFLKKTSQFVYKQFKKIWIAVTIVALFIGLSINWNAEQAKAYDDINAAANKLGITIDDFIKNIFQEASMLPIDTDCTTSLYPYLQHITLNNPNIAGIILNDANHKLICSNIPNFHTSLANMAHDRTIAGPYNLPSFDQPIYLIQQKIGIYYIDVLITRAVLQKLLKTQQDISNAISLYNKFNKKSIINVEYKEPDKLWVLNSSSKKEFNSFFINNPLQTMDDVVLMVFENTATKTTHVWYSQILIAFIILLLSLLIYLSLINAMRKRYSLHGAMKLALKNNEFYPEYQPLFDCERQAFTGAEVLLRWQDSDNEIIMPDFFIAEAETTGIIVPITLQIVEKALQEMQPIFKQFPAFHLGFNISALHFIDKHFFKHFYHLLKKYKVSPHQILLEITERDLIDLNNNLFSEQMSQLRTDGFSLAVDDYGTGHASISYLHKLPFNYLKIDKLFVQAIGSKAITESLNDAIIHMAKGLNLIIIAEGVETQQQVDYLAENGVRYLQGWYFARALPINQLISLFNGEMK